MRCPSCGAISPPSTRFCERDGSKLVAEGSVGQPTADLSPLPLACACGSTTYDDGFCAACGLGAPRASRAFDHVEQAPVPELAGVTDRGQRHLWNEDALSLAAEQLDEPVYVAVVCDGVSQARGAQQAAQTAAEVARGRLLEAARANLEPTAALHQAILAAHVAVCALPDDAPPARDPARDQPPGCTIVAALVRDGHATIGWVGDSRAYRFAPDLTQLLTHDHSWFNAVVDAGEMSPLEAAGSPNRNAILQAVGPLNFDECAPHQAPVADVVSCDLLPGHVLLLCSDGLWKYAPEAAELADLVQTASHGVGPLELTRRLVEYANTRGGTDNVTAAILHRT